MKWTVQEAKKLALQVGIDPSGIDDSNLDVYAKKIRKKLRSSGTSIRDLGESPPSREEKAGRLAKAIVEEFEEKPSKVEPRSKTTIFGSAEESIYLEFLSEDSKKFYAIARRENSMYSSYGRIGSVGKENPVEIESSPEAAHRAFTSLARKKMRNGYREKPAPPGLSIMGVTFGPATSKISMLTPEKKSGFPKITVSPMLAKDVDDVDRYLDDPSYIAQQKFDGTRCLIIKEDDAIYMIGRSWKSNYAKDYPKIVKEASEIKHDSFIIDSELTFFKPGGGDHFLTALATPESRAGYTEAAMAFDILELDGENLRGLPCSKRIDILATVISSRFDHIKFAETVFNKKREYFKKLTGPDYQGEGVILKKLSSKYQEGARNRDWIKVKAWKADEAVVVGVTEGTGVRIDTFGSLVIAKHRHGKLGYCGKISGFTNDEQQDLIEDMKSLVTKDPQVDLPRSVDIKYWVKPKIIVEVKYQEITPDGLFRFPSFLRVRDDKEVKDV